MSVGIGSKWALCTEVGARKKLTSIWHCRLASSLRRRRVLPKPAWLLRCRRKLVLDYRRNSQGQLPIPRRARGSRSGLLRQANASCRTAWTHHAGRGDVSWTGLQPLHHTDVKYHLLARKLTSWARMWHVVTCSRFASFCSEVANLRSSQDLGCKLAGARRLSWC